MICLIKNNSVGRADAKEIKARRPKNGRKSVGMSLLTQPFLDTYTSTEFQQQKSKEFYEKEFSNWMEVAPFKVQKLIVEDEEFTIGLMNLENGKIQEIRLLLSEDSKMLFDLI